MTDFEWNLPTEIKYGKGILEKSGEFAKRFGKKALVVTYATYGNNGRSQWIVEKVLRSLKSAGLDYVVFGKIEPNPLVKTVDAGSKVLLENQCDFVVAVGGGSVIDGAKYIAATAKCGGSAWDYAVLAERKEKTYTDAFSIVAIPTVAAAGSEANAGGVITNEKTLEKSFARAACRIPKIAIIDPEAYQSLPESVTADGCVDIFSHLIEHYLSSDSESELADRITEALILTLIKNTEKVMQSPDDLEARGQLAITSTLGWSGVQALGRTGTIPIHFLEHQFSSVFELSHGRGIAILIPAYMEYFADVKPARWARMARNVFGVVEANDVKAAKMLHVQVRKWFSSFGMDLKFSDVGIKAESFDRIADDVLRMYGTADGGKVPGARPMTREDILAVYDLAK